ncbi:MAG: hypothetical protein AAF483_30755 [Planctomycetota bacterium]
MGGKDHHKGGAHNLIQSSLWCGTVFGLSVLIVSLNIFPPSNVEYDVNTKILVASTQLPWIEDAVTEESSEIYDSAPQIHLESMEDLKVADGLELRGQQSQEYRQVALKSIWSQRWTEERHEAWIADLTQPNAQQIDQTEYARELRLANWEVTAARHYLDRETYLSQPSPSSSSMPNMVLASESGSTKGGFASFQKPAKNVIFELEHNLQSKVSTQQLAHDSWQQQLENSRAFYQIVETPKVSLRIAVIPTLILVSIFSIGIFSGASASLLHHRIQSGGSYSPKIVAQQLVRLGLPLVGQVEVSDPLQNDLKASNILGRLFQQFLRLCIQNLTKIGEWILAFWVLLLLCRLLTDELWRQLVLQQPLVALSQLFIGLP